MVLEIKEHVNPNCLNNILISLCIPTLNRFDKFLQANCVEYVKFLDEGLIDEIVICDENGNDYDKMIKYDLFKKYIQNGKLRLFKNNEILGVFSNKLKVCSLARNNYIALIDSDNFCERNYFNVGIDYIIDNGLNNTNNNFILAPSFAKPNFNFKLFQDHIINRNNIKQFLNGNQFGVLINTGNYILTKDIINNIKFTNNKNILTKISACDVMFFNLLVFKQFNNFNFHIVKNLEYEHAIHDDSEYLKTNSNCAYFREMFIKPEFYKLK